MKLAAVGTCDSSAPGREMVDALRQLSFSSVYLVPGPSSRVDRVPISACFIPKGSAALEMRRFLDLHKPDVLVTWGEIPDPEFQVIWKEKGVRWVHIAHVDRFDSDPAYRQAKLIAPTAYCRRKLREAGLSSSLLAIPVDTEKFLFRQRKIAKSFLTVCDPEDPNTLPQIFMAWWELEDAPPLAARSGSKLQEFGRCLPPDAARIELLKDREDFYLDMDVGIQVAGESGGTAPILEAMASGIPVLSVKSSPVEAIVPELSVDVDLEGVVSVGHLRERIQTIRGSDLSHLSRQVRVAVEGMYSWKALRSMWIEILR